VRLALVLAGIVVAVGAAIAAINRIVDPKNEFYSGAPLTEALESNCLLAGRRRSSRSYPEFKRDLLGRRNTKTVVFDSNAVMQRGVNLGFPGFGRRPCSTRCRPSQRATPQGRRLNVYVVTNVSWFDPAVSAGGFDTSFAERARYLLSPWTVASSLDLMRRSRTLAFTGWEKERAEEPASSTAARPSRHGARTARSRAGSRKAPRRCRRALPGTGSPPSTKRSRSPARIAGASSASRG
jgi:hypothetical protein